MSPIQFLLSKHTNRPKVIRDDGFTLIELLVASIIAVLVITPLFGFMINILNTDRQEQAKASSEQEIQSAMDYIARDLQQAVYIYNEAGIDAIKAQLPSPDDEDRVPVLVFWKREFINGVLTAADNNKDDTFVYSLVAYYLIQDTSTTWSKAARIARWQIRDGVKVSGGVDCSGYTDKYVSGYCPSAGYAPFKLEGVGTLTQKMNQWTRLSSYTTTTNNVPSTTNVSYGDSPVVLVDYIDQTTTTSGAPSAITCPTGTSKVTPASFNGRTTGQMTSFYACVDTTNTAAQVFLRGNALARVRNSSLNYNSSRKNYFPEASVRVQGRGFLFTQ
jgi:prepilin-type N-terminal cleavage/methylation domain-containing protein